MTMFDSVFSSLARIAIPRFGAGTIKTFIIKEVLIPLALTAGISGVVISQMLNSDEDRKVAAAEIKTQVLERTGALESELLFHYTDIISAEMIMATQRLKASPDYPFHRDGIPRPPGGYATSIPPWLEGATKSWLRSQIYNNPNLARYIGKQDAFVTIAKDPEWIPIPPSLEWYKPGVGFVDVIAVGYFMNPMAD